MAADSSTLDGLFQSTLLQEERPYDKENHMWTIRFQSTLLQEERRFMTLIARKIVMISIHAPTRGATKDIEVDMLSSKISIHAPTRGATTKTEM